MTGEASPNVGLGSDTDARAVEPVERDARSKKLAAGSRNRDAAEVRVGAQLGSYRLIELLGQGGMGSVYRAEHVKLGRQVALKLLRPDCVRRRNAVLRFFQEAKTVNRVRHRNIVDATDFVELDDGTTFIIMELLRGPSLGAWAQGTIELPRAFAVLVQICDGLGAAHAVGVVHRDLKPDNVIVEPTPDGAELVKLLDFGVAKLMTSDEEDSGFQTAVGSVIGTPAYMSPEQAGGMPVDHRADIYSLGAIMYELFCGQPMFRGRSFGEFVRMHLSEQPKPPRQTKGGANIDERLEKLILKCVAKDPNARFAQILELREGLVQILSGPGIGAVEKVAEAPAAVADSAVWPRSPAFADSLHLGPNVTRAAAAADSAVRPKVTRAAAAADSAVRPKVTRAATVATLPKAAREFSPKLRGLLKDWKPYLLGDQSQSTMRTGNRLAHSAEARAKPRLLLLVGGVLAMGLVVAGVGWYATRSDRTVVSATREPTGQVAAQPTPADAPGVAPQIAPPPVTPPEPPPEPHVAPPPVAPPEPQVAPQPPGLAAIETTPPSVEIRFDSIPSGGVFAAGDPAVLCVTPCKYNIDLKDGGRSDRRKFVIRADHYRDMSITVDLIGTQRDFMVTLERSDPVPDVEMPAPPVDTTTAAATDNPDKSTHLTGKHPGRGSRKSGVDTTDTTERVAKTGKIDGDDKLEKSTKSTKAEKAEKELAEKAERAAKAEREKAERDKAEKSADARTKAKEPVLEKVQPTKGDHKIDKSADRKDGSHKPEVIDPHKTLDPFHPH